MPETWPSAPLQNLYFIRAADGPISHYSAPSMAVMVLLGTAASTPRDAAPANALISTHPNKHRWSYSETTIVSMRPIPGTF